MEYYAKSVLPNGKKTTVKEHSIAVAALCEQFATGINLQREARLAGLLHDTGKYGRFQDVLNGTASRVDHAICGAALLYRIYGGMKDFQTYAPVLEAINGHHDGLLEIDLLYPQLKQNLNDSTPIENHVGKTSSISGTEEYQQAASAFQHDHPGYKFPILKPFLPSNASTIDSMLYTRMLFSCLVDADYSVSAMDQNPDYLQDSSISTFDPASILSSLYDYREKIRGNSTADNCLNKARDMVFDQCGNKGTDPEGIFTLTAPTGTGKTLSLLHFALKHCIAHGKKRVIIVLPFLTLTEQNAGTYRSIYPELLEDHSQSNLSDQEREFTERWDVPFIVTTSVRFFESLFSEKPGDCRKLHHIANSVVVFDEAQSLPAELTSTTLQAVQELCRRYHTTMVFSTATQPHYDALSDVNWKPNEILENNTALYHALRRTNIRWEIKDNARTSLTEIADRMAAQTSICTIVNLRKHARKLFSLLSPKCSNDEIFFITTDLCAAHRRELISHINQRLKSGLPCRVVATQCIEAGVDFDFDVVYRALAPLDAIIQAAGRCNRNGRIPSGGTVVVFTPDEPEPLYPGNWYERAAQKVVALNHQQQIDIHDPAHIEKYYRLIFEDATDKPSLSTAIKNRSFSAVASEYRLIDDSCLRVIVPYDSRKAEYNAIAEKALESGLSPHLIKQASSITVSVSTWQRDNLETLAVPLFYSDKGRPSHEQSPFYILHPQNESLYLTDMGLQLPTEAATGWFA